MKQLITSLVLGLLIAVPTLSTSSIADQRSTEILNKVSKTYKSFNTVKANFTISTKSTRSSSNNKESGKLFLKGKKFKIELAGQEIYCDGKTIWTYLKDANEVQITEFDESSMEISPSNIFTIYEKGFIHKFIGDKTLGGKVYHQIELTPTDKSKPYFKVKMQVNSADSKVKSMEVNMKSGITTTYTINKFASNVNIADSFFTFDSKSKPKGLVEVDFR